jgi:hypothetical protein
MTAKYIFMARLGLCSDHFSGWLHLPGVLNKDSVVWIDGARPANTFTMFSNGSFRLKCYKFALFKKDTRTILIKTLLIMTYL